jgi:DNA-binding CsgD family transcriptional regulator
VGRVRRDLAGDDDRYGSLLGRAAALARARGELGTLADALGMRAAQLAFEQRFDEASIAAGEAVQLAQELSARNLELIPSAALALVAAVQGRDEEARRRGQDVLAHATANELVLRASMAVYALALVDLGRARWADALQRLDSLIETGSAALDPLVAMTLPDKIEAAVRAGRPDDARDALPLFESWAAYSHAAWAQARLAACRGLLADGDGATAHYEEALRRGTGARPFDLARVRLVFGEHLRRERRRTDARVQLRAALEAFEHLRAEPWAEKARAELRASGETARKRDPSTISNLTPQEPYIARLVADGLSNKDVAAQLFLSPRTVDSHLRNVFAKLGITSRTQLARVPLGEPSPVA